MREGIGVQIWSDKSKYEGEWKQNAAWGYGKLTKANGEVY